MWSLYLMTEPGNTCLLVRILWLNLLWRIMIIVEECSVLLSNETFGLLLSLTPRYKKQDSTNLVDNRVNVTTAKLRAKRHVYLFRGGVFVSISSFVVTPSSSETFRAFISFLCTPSSCFLSVVRFRKYLLQNLQKSFIVNRIGSFADWSRSKQFFNFGNSKTFGNQNFK
jgi:hypothetical protein